MSVELMKVQVGGHTDHRRVIREIILPRLPFLVIQEKSMDFTEEAVQTGLAVGNHYHTEDSGRAEFFVATGPEGIPLFRFVYETDGVRHDVLMSQGDACLILPESPHTFVPLFHGAVLRGFSNLPYNSAHDVTHKLV